jgi:hypothetical protein
VHARRLPGAVGLSAVIILAFPCATFLRAQALDSTADASPMLPATSASPVIPSPSADPLPMTPPLKNQRILGVIPDFQTVRDPNAPVVPLTVRQKFTLAYKETADPFNLANAMMTAGFSQMGDETPKYGHGAAAYGERFAAAVADFGTQNFFSAGVLASVLHQDPRYFRKGPQSKLLTRVAYSVSRIVITRQDAGGEAFNASGIFGMLLGIGASNAYYPAGSVRGPVMVDRIYTSLLGGVTGNLMSEFWPDVQRFLQQKNPFHKK